ncbi:MAG: hypothetical protein V1794_01900 [Candidatus Glassbacteria bacterium]
MKLLRIGVFAGALLAALPLAAQDEQKPLVVNPKVTTDKSVDCGSLDGILSSLIHGGMTDEQKVIAVFNWIRRVLYHGDGPEEIAYDFGKMIHSMGNGSCLRQTTPLALLLSRLGYQSQSWVHDTHHMLQVRYGGGWHCFDPHMNFYVYDRSSPRQVASIEQLRADSTLAWAAVAEGRAAPGFLLCGDSPRWFSGGGDWRQEEGWPEMKVEEPFGQITLRRGESYTFEWLPGDYYYEGAWQFDCGPYHTCGPNDSKDPANWPLFEPHQAVVNGVLCYRHWGQGRIAYYPDMFSDRFEDGVVRQRNILRLCPCFVLMPQDITREGELVFRQDCPYVVTGGEFKVEKQEMKGPIRAEVSIDGMKTWLPVAVTDDGNVVRGRFDKEVNGSFNGYYLKLILAGDSSLQFVEILTYFQHNPYALPYLVPGKNVIKVQAQRFGSPLKLEWSYAEGPGWDRPVTVSRTFREGGELTIEVGGQKYPRNLSLTLSVLP